MDFAHHRQLFLTEQGYSYEILDESDLYARAVRSRAGLDRAVFPPMSGHEVMGFAQGEECREKQVNLCGGSLRDPPYEFREILAVSLILFPLSPSFSLCLCLPIRVVSKP